MNPLDENEHFLKEDILKSHIKLSALINNIDDLVCARDRNGALLVWNDAFAEFIQVTLGVKPHVGMKTVDYISPEQKDNFKQPRELLQRVLAGERINTVFTYTYANYTVKYFELTWAPIWKDKEVIGTVECVRDVSRAKEVEKKLRENEEKIRAFIQNSSEGIWCFDLEQPLSIDLSIDEQIDHIYKYAFMSEVNDTFAQMYGYEAAEELIGFRVEDFHPRSNLDDIALLKQLVRDRYCSTNWETTEFTRLGEIRIFSAKTFGIFKNGHLVRTWGTQRDITEQRRAEKELQESQKDLRHLAGRLLTVQEEERRRLARELHDDLTQRLAVLSIDAGKLLLGSACSSEAATVLQSMQEKLIKISEDVHSISRQLHPSIIEDLGLEDALRSEIKDFSKREEVTITFESDPGSSSLPLDIAICLFRITQESLRNVKKHSSAKNVMINLALQDDAIFLNIRDDGQGFDPQEIKKMPGLGLKSMRERIRLVNGSITYTSKLGQGTEVTVEVSKHSTMVAQRNNSSEALNG